MLNYHAVVDATYTGENGARVNGVPTYKQVASALHDAPAIANAPHVIFIKRGRYQEKLTIDKSFVTLIGESQAQTILTFDDVADTKKPDGTMLGTFESASVSVLARDVRIENLTIENSFDYPANAAKANNDPTRLVNVQAVALKLDGASDRVVLRNVSLAGYQDTLYVNAGRSYFQQCEIAGHIDFIFGAGQAVFDNCEIVSRERGYITAASTSLDKPFGFLFINCRLKKASHVLDGTVALGRPWHPTTSWADGTRSANPNAVGCVVLKNCWMDSHILPAGWDRMHSWDKNRNQIWFYPEDARFFEYGNTGPGAIVHHARRVLSAADAEQYTIQRVLEGWNPLQDIELLDADKRG